MEIHKADNSKDLIVKVHDSYPKGTIYNIYEQNTGNVADYIFEIVDHGELFGIDFFRDGHSQIISPYDYRFNSGMIVGGLT